MTGATGPEELSGYIEVKVPSGARRRGLTPWKAWKRQWCAVRRGKSENAPLEVQIGSGADSRLQVAAGATVWRAPSRSKQFAFGVFCGGPTGGVPSGGEPSGGAPSGGAPSGGAPSGGELQRPVLFFAGRSEFESQKWIRGFRDLLRPPRLEVDPCHRVSLIDTDYTLAAGLAGLYGNLQVTAQEVTICDPATHEVKVTWVWKHLQQFHLAATGRPEDKAKICVIHTSREFHGGAGNIYLFCEDAPDLLQSLLRASRLQRLLLSPLPTPPPLSLRNARRLSRSENDLSHSWTDDALLTTPKSASIAVTLRPRYLSTHSDKRSSTQSEDSSSPAVKNKTATSLISASLGLMFSTPGCSEADSESLHEYQHIGFCEGEDDVVGNLVRVVNQQKPTRRESGISIASGIYEEIPDVPPEDNIFHMDVTAPVVYANCVHAPVPPLPPPLPPRRRHLFRNLEQMTDCSFSGSSPQLSSPASSSSWEDRASKARFLWATEIASSLHSTHHEPDYMPMSPSFKGRPMQPMEEQHYMVMSSIDTAL